MGDTSYGRSFGAPSATSGSVPQKLGSLAGTDLYGIPGAFPFTRESIPLGANADHFFPWFAWESITVIELAIYVNVAAAGNARLAIYNADADWQPTTLVVDAGTVSTGTTGKKAVTSLTAALTAGSRYLAAINLSGTGVSLEAWNSPSPIGGIPDNLGAGSNNSVVEVLYNARAHAAFPDPGTVWSAVDAKPGPPWHVIVARWT